MGESLTQSLTAGAQITLHREKSDSLRNVPRSRNTHVPSVLARPGQDPDQKWEERGATRGAGLAYAAPGSPRSDPKPRSQPQGLLPAPFW